MLLYETSSSFPQKTSFSLIFKYFLLRIKCCSGSWLATLHPRLFEIPMEKMNGKSTPNCYVFGWNCPASRQPPLFWCRKAPGAAEATEDLGWHSEPRLWLRAPVIASESSRMFSSAVKAQRPKSLLTEPCKDPATPEAGCIKLIITFPFHQALFRFI